MNKAPNKVGFFWRKDNEEEGWYLTNVLGSKGRGFTWMRVMFGLAFKAVEDDGNWGKEAKKPK